MSLFSASNEKKRSTARRKPRWARCMQTLFCCVTPPREIGEYFIKTFVTRPNYFCRKRNPWITNCFDHFHTLNTILPRSDIVYASHSFFIGQPHALSWMSGLFWISQLGLPRFFASIFLSAPPAQCSSYYTTPSPLLFPIKNFSGRPVGTHSSAPPIIPIPIFRLLTANIFRFTNAAAQLVERRQSEFSRRKEVRARGSWFWLIRK